MRRCFSVPWWVCGAVCLCIPWLQLRAQPSLEDISRALEARGIAFDPKAVDRVAVQALLRSLDPGARLLRTRPGETAADRDAGTPPVAEEWPVDVLYLRLDSVGDTTAAAVRDKLEQWAAAGRGGLILDLRKAEGSSPLLIDVLAGGLAGASAPLYEVRDSTNGIVEAHVAGTAAEGRIAATLPWVVLTSKKTAGDAELLAAVLKGMPGVLLVGARTRGDAAVREVLDLGEGDAILIATSWRIPAGGAGYDRRGVVPDVPLSGKRIPVKAKELPGRDSSGRALTDDAKQGRELMGRANGDACVKRAIDVLLALKALPKTQHGQEAGGADAAGN